MSDILDNDMHCSPRPQKPGVALDSCGPSFGFNCQRAPTRHGRSIVIGTTKVVENQTAPPQNHPLPFLDGGDLRHLLIYHDTRGLRLGIA